MSDPSTSDLPIPYIPEATDEGYAYCPDCGREGIFDDDRPPGWRRIEEFSIIKARKSGAYKGGERRNAYCKMHQRKRLQASRDRKKAEGKPINDPSKAREASSRYNKTPKGRERSVAAWLKLKRLRQQGDEVAPQIARRNKSYRKWVEKNRDQRNKSALAWYVRNRASINERRRNAAAEARKQRELDEQGQD